jgi:hypothetical protein
MPGALCTRSLVGGLGVEGHTSSSHHEFTGITQHSRTQWF